MKSSSNPKPAATRTSLNRSALSLLDEEEAAKISAHAASHAKPKCKLCDIMIFVFVFLVMKCPSPAVLCVFYIQELWQTWPALG